VRTLEATTSLEPKSKVEHLSRSLHRIAIVSLCAFLAASVAAVAWVDNEFTGDAPLWRYIISITACSGFLVAAVIAQVGSALVQALGRVRASLIEAILDQQLAPEELASRWPESHTN
jgi:hypothetical protein